MGLFTTAAVDNIDHNPSFTTARDSFHGTRISLFQPIYTKHPGVDRGAESYSVFIDLQRDKTITKIPFTYFRPAFLHNQNRPVFEVQCEVKGDRLQMDQQYNMLWRRIPVA